MVAADDDNLVSAIDRLGTDELVNIFECLPAEDIIRARLNKKMREAAKRTVVQKITYFRKENRCSNYLLPFHTVVAMSTALPNLEQLKFGYLGWEHKFNEGEDPDEQIAANEANFITHEIEILYRFRKLRLLKIHYAPLNGRYPLLLNFPLLQYLSLNGLDWLKLDLEVLERLLLLIELHLHDIRLLTGNINSVRVLKDTLESIDISFCPDIEGNFMDLADFPRLNELILRQTSVTGDIRDIGERDFLALEVLTLPKGVYGGSGREFQLISDVPDVMNTLYSFRKQRPCLWLKDWYGELSEDSPDWYDGFDGVDIFDPCSIPFEVRLVAAGSRIGYRWESRDDHPCEAIWLEPEPDLDSSDSDYDEYIEELEEIERQVVYRGFQQPPTEEEYGRLVSELED
mmetsp:Transcript_2068/g.3289  ORF Transcript_2068/g.3289 Transcript_2068/m.3289 type:complete len:401 (+) Transcript_2068:130-1332(+)